MYRRIRHIEAIEEWLRLQPQARKESPAQVSGSSTGAPLLLLAEEQELEAVRLWLASAAPKYEAIQKEDAVKSKNVTRIFNEFSAWGDTSRGTYSPSRYCTCMFSLNTAWELVVPEHLHESNQNWTRTLILPYMNLSWLPQHRFKLCIIHFLPFLSHWSYTACCDLMWFGPLCTSRLPLLNSPVESINAPSNRMQSGPQVIKASLQQQTPVRKVAGNQLAAILMSTPFTFERLGLNVSTLDHCHLITVSFAPFLIWTKAELAEHIALVIGDCI